MKSFLRVLNYKKKGGNWKKNSTQIGLEILNSVSLDPLSSLFYKSLLSFTKDNHSGRLHSGSTIIPHPDKIERGGEDALVVKKKLIAVADGVGGWASQGVDAGKYSKQLTKTVGEVFEANPKFAPKDVLVEAWKRTTVVGSSTWVIVILDPETKTISSTSLGDSVYLLVRPTDNNGLVKIFRSEEQQHSFNFPFQCGTDGDDPISAIDHVHSVNHNDIIIMGSDGIFDNWFDEEILKILNSFIDSEGNVSNPKEASEKIALYAERHSCDKNWKSPFQKNSEKPGVYKVFRGGKQDDISIIVSQIKFNN